MCELVMTLDLTANENNTPIECQNKSKYKKVGVLLIRIVKSNVSSVGPSSVRNGLVIRIGGTLTFSYFDLYW